MNQEQLLDAYKKMEQSIDAAPESPTPYPIVKDEKLHVIGDANETQINKHDFKIVFRLPEGVVDGEKTIGGVLKEVEYKDVFVPPRQSGKVISSLCRMLPFFRKVVDMKGNPGEKETISFTSDEVVEMLAEFGDDFVDDMYDLVGKFLKIDDALVDYMIPESAMKATLQILNEYPEIINEAEAFFS